MRPEDVLSALVGHTKQLYSGEPDRLQLAARRPGKQIPRNWRMVTDSKGKTVVEYSWPAIRTALGRSTRGLSKGSLVESAGDALAGMPVRQWRTLQVAIGINRVARQALARRLMTLAHRSRRRERFWPAAVLRRPCSCRRHPAEDYVADLVELALLELEQPEKYGTHRLRAKWFGMPESSWYAYMRLPHDELARHVWGWYHGGLGYIVRRLRQPEKNIAI